MSIDCKEKCGVRQAGVITELFDFLKSYAKHKAFQQESQLPAVLESIGKYELAGDVRRCGTLFTFDKYQNKADGQMALKQVAGNTCKHKYCSFCQWRLSRKTLIQLMARIACLKERHGDRLHFGLLTKTYPNPKMDKVRETYKKLSTAEGLFCKHKKIKKRFLGCFTAYEYFGDKTKSGEAHLHSHSLVAFLGSCNERYTQMVCRDVWESVLKWKNDPNRHGDYHLQVDFRRITEKPELLQATAEIEPDAENNVLNENFKKICGGVLEVVKYCTAPQVVEKLSKDDFKTLIKETKGLRKYRTSGCFYKFEFPDGKDENFYLKQVFGDYKDLDDEAIWEWICRLNAEWRCGDKNYLVFDGTLENHHLKVVAKVGAE